MLATITRPPESCEARRARELGHDIGDVDARLRQLNERIRLFRSKWLFWFQPADGQITQCWRVQSLAALAELKAELAAMESDREKLAVLKNALLAEYGTVKG